MKISFEARLVKLANLLHSPLYAVGGCVRNFLIGDTNFDDVDLSGAISIEALIPAVKQVGFNVLGEYKRTGTVVFGDNHNRRYEYTCFRKEVYANGGGHTPIKIEPTDSVYQDALRRDFKCNAVYYDIKNDAIVDPLGGEEDIKNKVLDTVTTPQEVFSHDGLRLMRLARFCGELNFTPTPQVLAGATLYASNIKDISVERVYAELTRMLCSDKKYSFSDKNGHYTALKILDKTRVLDYILPELALGRDMAQRKDYHDYDVLEHSLKCVLYAPQQERLTALLHDVGKPFCMKRDGNYYQHAQEGVRIANEILKRLKAPEQVIKRTKRLINYHMLDMDLKVRQSKLRRFIVDNADILDGLLALKQADFSASKGDVSVCPAVEKWQKLYAVMLSDGTPFNLKQLKITANDLVKAGYTGQKIGETLKKLFYLCVYNPKLNDHAKLFEMLNNSVI